MNIERFDDEIWDEYRWEEHINHIEKRAVELTNFFNRTWGATSPSWERLLDEYQNQNDVIDAYIEEAIINEEAYFPDDEDWDDEEEDEPDNELFMESAEEDYNSTLPEKMDALFEEVLQFSGEFRIEDMEFVEDIYAYNLAREFGLKVLTLAESRSDLRSETYFDSLVNTALQISAKLAIGFNLGFEFEVIGGNIIYSKKALDNANSALELLTALKSQNLLLQADYYELHQLLTNVRNEIGMYIQDLRESIHLSNY
jgi:hypothetical protein